MDLNRFLDLVRTGENEHIEFKRSLGNDINRVVVAFANADGGTILVGVEDDGSIVGCDSRASGRELTNAVQSVVPSPRLRTDLMTIHDKDVLIIEVERMDGLCAIGGVAYIRIGAGIRPLSIQEVVSLSSELGMIHWDESPRLPYDEADHSYIDWFFQRLEEERGRTFPPKARIKYLRSIGAVRGVELTNAGVLFFTEATGNFPHAKVRLVFIEGDRPTSERTYEGPIWKIIDAAFQDMLREGGGTEEVVGARRIRVGGYPPRVLREALINAVAHRNYAISADVRVMVHPHRIVIRNPGGLLPGVVLSDPDHIPRNPSLCNLLFDAGFIERYGHGIDMMRREVEGRQDLELEFDVRPQRFDVVIEKRIDAALDELDKRILECVSRPARSGRILEKVQLSRPALLARLKRLEEMGLVRKTGRGPATRYQQTSTVRND